MTAQDYSPGRELSDYPRPSLAVDVAAFTYSRNFRELKLLVIRSDDGGFRLPGSFVRENEQLTETVSRTMASKVGLKSQRATLLSVFDRPGRDPRGWVITIAHLLVVPEDDVETSIDVNARWVNTDVLPPLQGDHTEIVRAALEKLRVEYEIDQRLVKENFERPTETSMPRNVYAGKPDPEGFFSKPFTLRELQVLHETVAGRQFMSTKPSRPRTSLPTAVGDIAEMGEMRLYSAPPPVSRGGGGSGMTTGSLRDTFRRLMEPQLAPRGVKEGSRGAPSRTWIVAD